MVRIIAVIEQKLYYRQQLSAQQMTEEYRVVLRQLPANAGDVLRRAGAAQPLGIARCGSPYHPMFPRE